MRCPGVQHHHGLGRILHLALPPVDGPDLGVDVPACRQPVGYQPPGELRQPFFVGSADGDVHKIAIAHGVHDPPAQRVPRGEPTLNDGTPPTLPTRARHRRKYPGASELQLAEALMYCEPTSFRGAEDQVLTPRPGRRWWGWRHIAGKV